MMVPIFLEGAAGAGFPAAAVLIGASGSFVTGTGLGSNIMFAPMHVNACGMLGLNPITVFAGQNAGGSLGNLVKRGKCCERVLLPLAFFWYYIWY